MKNLKKFLCIGFIVTIILLICGTSALATVNELTEDDLIPALEEKLKSEQEDDEDEEDTEEELIESDEEDEAEDEKSDAGETIRNAISRAQREDIEEDIFLIETEELIYENANIDGNAYIISTEKIYFTDVTIYGNLFIIADEVQISDSEIYGNVYILSNEFRVDNSYVEYAYIASESIIVETDVEIEDDLKIVATSATIGGVIGRDLDSITSYIELDEDIEIERYINISTETYEIPKSIEKSSNLNLEIIEIEETETTMSDLISSLLPELLVEFVIILIIAAVILGGSPKFTEVNSKLKLKNFVKSFFTGILEILIINVIAILLIATIYGMGYGIAVLIFTLCLLYFGKAIFIIAFAIRLVKKDASHVKIKAFLYTILVAAIVQIIGMISVLGTVGFVINLIINAILGFTGFGTLVKVILTSTKKKEKNQTNQVINNNLSEKNEVQQTETPKVVETIPEKVETKDNQETKKTDNNEPDDNKETEKTESEKTEKEEEKKSSETKE